MMQHSCDTAAVPSWLKYWEMTTVHMIADQSDLGCLHWITVTVSLSSTHLPRSSSSYWNDRLERGWAQLAFALSHVLKCRASCQLGSWVDPYNIVSIFSKLFMAILLQLIAGSIPLSADFGSHDNTCFCFLFYFCIRPYWGDLLLHFPLDDHTRNGN